VEISSPASPLITGCCYAGPVGTGSLSPPLLLLLRRSLTPEKEKGGEEEAP